MEHKGTVRLETERLILRQFTINDVEAAFCNWTSDDKVTEFLRWPTHKNISITESVLKDWIENYKNNSFYQWAIVPKDLNEPIGTISVVGMDDRIDMVHIGYCIGSKWWKKGYTSEAFAGIISFLFSEVKVQRIESQHDPNNPNSGMVMKKCGLEYEGTLRKADWSNKGIVDVCIYSLLAEDYYKRKIYLDVTELKECTSVWMKDAEIIRAGTTVYSMPIKDKNSEYQRYADEYDIHFIFDDNIPVIDFYTIPQVDIMATDSKGGYIGTIGQMSDLESDAPICYIDKNTRKSYLIAESGEKFLKKASTWKESLEAYDGIRFYHSKKDAMKENEFVNIDEFKEEE